MNKSKSSIIEYLKQIAKMTQGRQHEYYQWKVDNAELLTHVKTDEIREQYPEIDRYLKSAHPKVVQKECYKNAGQITQAIEGVSYVEGEILYHGIPLEHAWNKIDGKYFDITKDILFPKNSDYAEYVKIIELNEDEYRDFIIKYEHWGGFVSEKYRKDHKMEESFYPQLLESSAMDKYREKTFGIRYGYNQDDVNSYHVVAKVGKYKTPIILNPKSLEGIDPDVRAIADNQGNLYVAMHQKYFNHGSMANALISSHIINTIWYNEEKDKISEIRGIYEDQKNFFLLERFEDEYTFVQSDTFEWEGTYSEEILRNLEQKNPQFKYDIEHDFDDEFDEIDESVINESPDNFKYNDKYYEADGELGNSLSFEVIYNNDKDKIADVLISNRKNCYHGSDNITAGPHYGYPGDDVYYRKKARPYDFSWEKIYPGRIFRKPKVITFWVYPNEKEMKQIIKIIEAKTKLKIIDNEWTIEIYKEGIRHKGKQRYANNYNTNSNKKEFIPVEKFAGSKRPPEKEYIKHLDTKTKHIVPFGYGSKNPKYMDKRKWQMASLTDESKKEPFYPRLD